MHIQKNVPSFSKLSTINPSFKAVLWDMDGTIMETEVLHAKSTLEILAAQHKEFKSELPEVEEVCMGQTDQTILEYYQEQGFLPGMDLAKFIDLKNDSIENLLASTPNETIFKEDVKACMEDLKNNGIKQGVVTSSEKAIAISLLKHLGLEDYFQFIQTREDTPENKPSPMPYNVAIKNLGLSSSEVVIFEDSEVGLKAATGAMATVCKASWY